MCRILIAPQVWSFIAMRVMARCAEQWPDCGVHICRETNLFTTAFYLINNRLPLFGTKLQENKYAENCYMFVSTLL